MGIWLAFIFLALLAAYLIVAGIAAFVSPDLDWKLTRFANPWLGLPEEPPEGREGRRVVGGVASLLVALTILWFIGVALSVGVAGG